MPSKKKRKGQVSPAAQPVWVGFDLGGTKMLAVVFDEQYRALGSAKRSTQGSEGQRKGVTKIISAIHEALAAAGCEASQVQGIGLGAPGLVDPSRGVLIKAPNLGWKNVQLRRSLGTVFRCPVAVVNDVDAGTYGEFHLGAGKGARSLLGVFPGTGLGGGFVYDGKLVRGKSISCMELGLLKIPGSGLHSDASGVVMVEDLSSRLAIASQAALGVFRGQAPALEKAAGTDLSKIKSKALAQSVKAGDPGTVLAIENSLRYMAFGVAAVVNLFAPDRIVLGGGLVEAMPQVYLKGLKTQVDRLALPELSKGVRYVRAKLGDLAVAAGALAYLRREGK